MARLRPQATAEPEGGIGEGNIAVWYGSANGLHTRQARGVAHPFQLATDFIIRDRRHEDARPLAEAAGHPRATVFGLGDPAPLRDDPEGAGIEEDHPTHA
jgi:hypothetical protein